ncbi:MAG: hypothetical protein RSG52_06215 [Terrisporobacter sp.]|uniref:hypothetical protein n=1 Tax=Terrisporobacter sp. TaxID=1965305 RepID=UPI002FC756FC
MKRKRNGFTSIECVVSLFILTTIIFVVTTSLHNSFNLLNKNRDNLQMLSIAKEEIEDERINIKNTSSTQSYNKSKRIENYIIETSVNSASYYKCYVLNLRISSMLNNMEFSTYVTKK